MIGQLRGWEWLVLVAIVLLLFGAKRLPDTARGLGRSLRIFKAETKGLVDDGDGAAAAGSSSGVDVTRESVQPHRTPVAHADLERNDT